MPSPYGSRRPEVKLELPEAGVLKVGFRRGAVPMLSVVLASGHGCSIIGLYMLSLRTHGWLCFTRLGSAVQSWIRRRFNCDLWGKFYFRCRSSVGSDVILRDVSIVLKNCAPSALPLLLFCFIDVIVGVVLKNGSNRTLSLLSLFLNRVQNTQWQCRPTRRFAISNCKSLNCGDTDVF